MNKINEKEWKNGWNFKFRFVLISVFWILNITIPVLLLWTFKQFCEL